jgi:hypothetical protein
VLIEAETDDRHDDDEDEDRERNDGGSTHGRELD